jgi:peptidyl-prolyl cis-trans isomerase SurA
MKPIERCGAAAALILGALLCSALGAGAEIVDGTVATVGTEVILRSDLIMEIAPFLHELQKTVKSDEEFNRQANDKMREALEQAIDNKILLREALLAGLEVKDNIVEERINEIKKRFSSNEEFQKELEKAGETASAFRERVRKQILAVTMGMRKRHQFEQEAEVTEAAMEQYYKDNSSKFVHAERVLLRRIFLPAGQDAAERAQVKARLQELKQKIDAGADFAELAQTYSGGPEAAKGGLVGWVNRKDLVKNVEDATFALPAGGVSGVIETEFGFVLLKADEKQTEGTTSLDDARKEIEPELRAKIADEKYKKWMGELRKRSRVRTFLS